MKSFCGFSYVLGTAVILFGVGMKTIVYAEEKCVERHRYSHFLDQPFGFDDYLTSMLPFWPFQNYFRPWRRLASLTKDLGSVIQTDKDQFKINLDVQHFSPNEITVKTADGEIVIEAKHEEKMDEHGYVSRHFIRRYVLPESTETRDVVSQLSSDGILTISAPRKVMSAEGERLVPITQTGPVRQESKDHEESKKHDDSSKTCEADKCEKI